MSTDRTNYIGVLFEEIRGQNKAVLEAVGDIKQKVDTWPTRDEFEEVKQDIKVIKAAVTDLSKEQHELDRRLTQVGSS